MEVLAKFLGPPTEARSVRRVCKSAYSIDGVGPVYGVETAERRRAKIQLMTSKLTALKVLGGLAR